MQTEKLSPVTLSDTILRFEGPNAWKKLGLIALATDLTCERDFARLLPQQQAGLYTTRVAFENPTTLENLRHMAPRLTAAADLILPGEPLDAICYSCTAASVVIGDEVVADAIHEARPGVPVVTPSGAARQAFAALGVHRIAILTPYLVETSLPMAAYFSRHGLEVIRLECFGLEDDRVMARVSGDSIIEAACKVDGPEVEAIFLSCTGLPAVPVIAEIETLTGKPVVTSNQASAWAMMRHAGLDHHPQGYGRLFDFDLATSD
ncbi:MAG: maleate isomerase [Planctomycetota bacterium]|jgi:maleate isomerase